MIEFMQKIKQFNLFSAHEQLAFNVLPTGHVVLSYFGKKIGSHSLAYVTKDLKKASYLADTDEIIDFRLEQHPLLFPTFGNPDLRTPAFQCTFKNGSQISDFRYHSYQITHKKKIPGLPTALNQDAETLELELVDKVAHVSAIIMISVFPQYDIFTQSIKIVNHSEQSLKIDRIMSINVDFLSDKYDLLTLSGAWGRENHLERRALAPGFQGVDSKRGASSHGQNPFIALADKDADEQHGNVYSLSLIYSGDFLASAEVAMHQDTRLQIGINPFGFSWQLEAGADFNTPEAILVHSDQGLNKMTHLLHNFYSNCLVNKKFAQQKRPIVLNNWEATYLDFDKQKLIALAQEGKKLGMEMFVLDNGWFGKEKTNSTVKADLDGSVGDWQANTKKIGGSLHDLVAAINKIGLKFGLWFEPEAVSPDSDTYMEHPGWIIRTPDRKPQLIKDRYLLNLGIPEVQDFLIGVFDRFLKDTNVAYIKWDLNRNLTDSGSSALTAVQQTELGHRYVLGLYKILETVTEKYPDVMIESCAGGGGRFDAGMLPYSPQIWTSDDSDAIERLEIQRGTSMIYPCSSMSCHVSTSPNEQVGRRTNLNVRQTVAEQGILGYELDLLALNTKGKHFISHAISKYKKYRQTYQFGSLDRLPVYDPQDEYAWSKQDENHLIVSYVMVLAKPNTVPKRLRLVNLQADAIYEDVQNKQRFTGQELMSIGLVWLCHAQMKTSTHGIGSSIFCPLNSLTAGQIKNRSRTLIS
ncbi:alpha-galactosidase [Ligilactobacillus salitolerans]|uniref:Alpha-galactosidase n=1 Tax=Ligilactobacillus salitolerans TaxID=1808352 RepID=A0A401IWC9_9LACO|nr:alpha-galactosidase [Ligilactobacillus salitolerans]GBG95844.1 alpha-galactosidase [Ligilactobacillus salitolerans]